MVVGVTVVAPPKSNWSNFVKPILPNYKNPIYEEYTLLSDATSVEAYRATEPPDMYV